VNTSRAPAPEASRPGRPILGAGRHSIWACCTQLRLPTGPIGALIGASANGSGVCANSVGAAIGTVPSSCRCLQADPHGSRHQSRPRRQKLSAQARSGPDPWAVGQLARAANRATSKGIDNGGPAPDRRSWAKAQAVGRVTEPWPAASGEQISPDQRENAASQADPHHTTTASTAPTIVDNETELRACVTAPSASANNRTLESPAASASPIGPSLIRWRRSARFAGGVAPPAAPQREARTAQPTTRRACSSATVRHVKSEAAQRAPSTTNGAGPNRTGPAQPPCPPGHAPVGAIE